VPLACPDELVAAALHDALPIFAEVARTMGFGQTFDIGIDGQKPGLVPDREWRRRNPVRGDGRWYPGETPSYGIGQGALTVNALRSEEHTSELQSRENLVCRLLL